MNCSLSARMTVYQINPNLNGDGIESDEVGKDVKIFLLKLILIFYPSLKMICYVQILMMLFIDNKMILKQLRLNQNLVRSSCFISKSNSNIIKNMT